MKSIEERIEEAVGYKRLLGKEFESRYGYLRCADLKRPGAPVPCEELVAGGARMLHAHLYPSDCE